MIASITFDGTRFIHLPPRAAHSRMPNPRAAPVRYGRQWRGTISVRRSTFSIHGSGADTLAVVLKRNFADHATSGRKISWSYAKITHKHGRNRVANRL